MARILVVEDEIVAAQSIREFLDNSEHVVVSHVASGIEALRVVAIVQPDLILMDIHLRGKLDGIATAAQIHQQFGTPIIYLTASTEDDVLQRAIATDPLGYLVKPFNQVELRTAIKIALHRHRLEMQLEQTEQWLSTTLTSIGDGTITTDREGYITFMNPVAEELTGWQQAEALGTSASQVLNLVNSETQEAIENPLLRAIQEGTRIQLADSCLLRTKDGRERIIGDSAAPIRNSRGEILGGVLVFQDITERKRAEKILHRREQEFRALVEHSPDLIARFDHTLRYLYVNPAAERIIHRNAIEFMGKTNSELGISRTVARSWDDALRQVLATAQETTLELELPTPSGVTFFQMRLVPEFAPSGGVMSVLSVARDISDRKHIEETLRLQAEREEALGTITQRIRRSLDLEDILNVTVSEIRKLIQADRVVIYRFTPSWSGFVIVESKASRWTSILGREIFDPCLATDACLRPFLQGHIGIIEDLQASGLADCYVELLTQLEVQANLVLPILQNQQLWGLLAVQHCSVPRRWQDWEIDLLSRCTAKLSIAIQQSELYTQVQQLNADLESQVLERTAMLHRALDFEALLKRITDKVRDSLDEDQILQTVVEELALGLGIAGCNTDSFDLEQQTWIIRYEYTVSLPSSQGQVVPFSALPAVHHQVLKGYCFQFCLSIPNPARPQSQPMATLICPIFDDQDILGDLWLFKEKEAAFDEQEIRLVQQVATQCAIALRQSRLFHATQTQVSQLERLNRLKDDFLSTISHEIRTPMSSIKMAIQMLEIVLEPTGTLQPETGAARRYFQILQTECQREIELIDNLLDISRLDTEDEPLILSTIAPHLWIGHAIEPFLDRIQQQQQQLVLHLPSDLPALVTDLSCLGRILSELMDNACKYTPPGGTITISAQTKSEGGQQTDGAPPALDCVLLPVALELSICNTGIEIPADELPRIFDTFYRVPSNDPWRYSGTGLGLALVKKLVAHLGGTIQAASSVDCTTFTLTLPLCA